MTPNFIRRVGGGVLSVCLVSLLTFALMRLGRGDAADALAGEQATEAQVQTIREQLGLNRPVLVQFGDWMWSAIRGDFGTSITSGRPVTDSLREAAPVTLSIALLALSIAAVVGVAVGALSGLLHGTLIDRGISVLATLGIAMPSFWVGLLLVSLFALDRPWFPATGYVPIGDGVWEWFRHAALPATALGLATAAEIARQTRSGVVDVLERPYIRAARARGATTVHLVRHHVLRNAAIPVVTVFALQVARLLGGTVVVEAVFGLSGLGTLAINGVLRRDYPMIQAYVVCIALVVIVLNALVDASYGLINPKLRDR